MAPPAGGDELSPCPWAGNWSFGRNMLAAAAPRTVFRWPGHPVAAAAVVAAASAAVAALAAAAVAGRTGCMGMARKVLTGTWAGWPRGCSHFPGSKGRTRRGCIQ